MANSSILALEHPLIKLTSDSRALVRGNNSTLVPLETLNKAFRTTQRNLDKESSYAASTLDDLVNQAGKQHLSPEDAAKSLDSMVTRLTALKRKLEDNFAEEERQITRCKVRLERINVSEAEQTVAWTQSRIDRILVDHLLRQELVDTQTFLECRRVEDALGRHECAEALSWCYENRSRLKKMKSTLEFKLRVQEMIELIRAGRGLEAIMHARKYLAPGAADGDLRDIQTAMGALAFAPDTTCPKYKALFDSSRWEELKGQFRADHYALHSFPAQSLLQITLQAGLSAFKTRMCYQADNKSTSCPVCLPPVNQLAEALPFSHRTQSILVCRINGDVINDHNPPCALPNGYVYGTRGLQDMADRNKGYVTCPRTKERYHISELKKVFIM